MLYNSVSINEVIARIIRNTRVQDSSYITDFQEWIPEAMEYMKTRCELKPAFEDVTVVFHKGKLPCDLVWLRAVEFEGSRLGVSDTVKDYRTGHNINDKTETDFANTKLFSSVIKVEPDNTHFDQQNLFWSSTAQPVNSLVAQDGCKQPSDFYSIEMGYITTSFPDGTVRIHYLARPVDGNGLPLIPDNVNYKEAIYYYVRAKMIGSGYTDKVYQEGELMQRFETYARRAINEITYPTPDEREQELKAAVRFIPPANYWENFFRVDNPESNISV